MYVDSSVMFGRTGELHEDFPLSFIAFLAHDHRISALFRSRFAHLRSFLAPSPLIFWSFSLRFAGEINEETKQYADITYLPCIKENGFFPGAQTLCRPLLDLSARPLR